MSEIEYKIRPSLSNVELNQLMDRSWNKSQALEKDFTLMLSPSLTYICAYHTNRLIGFVNVAWNGMDHAFILDTTVDPDFQRKGIGTKLVRITKEEARKAGIEWLHVDYEAQYSDFYKKCGFRHTEAGLIKLN